MLLRMFRKILLVSWLILSEASYPVSNVLSPAQINSLKELSELPLDKLLKVRKSLLSPSINRFDDNLSYNSGPAVGVIGPQAQPLTSDKKQFMRREYEHGDWTKEGNSKIRSAFQLSITTLSFLAFGGYLLCMIVQAVKNKGAFYPAQTQMQVPQPMFFSIPPVKNKPQFNIAGYGRKKRNAFVDDFSINFGGFPSGYDNTTENIENLKSKKQAGIFSNEGDMYHALIMLTEGFVAYS